MAHVEAGLRTHDIYSPFPEEANRKFLSQISHWHFAPTHKACENLRQENITKNIIVTGNTSIDTLRISSELVDNLNIQNVIFNQYPHIAKALKKN